ncbi:MAG TPA: carboxymuconolactone decarboxylase [Bacteroidales bacterium]|nr:carboxymuconolactone decarboxylase [Bacteroidales bacterium]
MRKAIIILLSVLLCGQHLMAQQSMNTNVLTPQQESFVALATYEATGDLVSLKPAIEQAFANGLTVNQVKEVFSHLYAYTGFPRSLNALGVLQIVLKEREEAGLATEMGAEASPLPADYDALKQGTAVQTQLCGAFTYSFCPAEDYYLKAHLFGDIFARDVLTHQQRELVTVSALAAMQGTEPQHKSHSRIAQTAGVPEETVEAATALAKRLTSPTPPRVPHFAHGLMGTPPEGLADSQKYPLSEGSGGIVFPVGKPNDAYAQYFIGQSYLAPLVGGEHPISNVTFEPACRNNWHIHHDARQILICVAGEGWYQEWGKHARRVKAGDVVDIPVGVKHWHGATRDSWFQHVVTHIAAEPLKGDTKTGNEWLEPVTDEQYNAL